MVEHGSECNCSPRWRTLFSLLYLRRFYLHSLYLENSEFANEILCSDDVKVGENIFFAALTTLSAVLLAPPTRGGHAAFISADDVS